MSAADACLDDDVIAALVEGALEPVAAQHARAHLGTCPTCRRLVSGAMNVGDTTGAEHRGDLARTMAESVTSGALIGGKYRVGRCIASGGMGRVFEAVQLSLERRVAIKIVLPGLASDPVATARFCREARMASLFASEGTVTIHDFGALASGEPYLVMELLEGEELDAVMSRGPVATEVASAWVRAAAETVGAAHACGIVHRDLSPRNLFLARSADGTQRVKVLDFGLAKLIGDDLPRLTAAGLGLGSPLSMAPEQVHCASTVDTRADVWALGVTLYRAISGSPPFDGRDLDELLANILRKPAASLRELVPSVDPELAALVARCLAKDPGARFADANELARALKPHATRKTEVMAPIVASNAQLLGGRYLLGEKLGAGAHGAVFRARQAPLDREVAIKILHREALDSPVLRQRFMREAAIVQRLEHPNTVRLYDAGEDAAGAPFLVFELVRGRLLADELRGRPMAPGRVARIATQVLNALGEAHRSGVIHRDLKPSNVMLVDHVGETDFVKLLDFGVARPDLSPALDATSPRPITDEGHIVGTPLYMAPEQLRGRPVDARADLYALGLVMAEALAGAPVFAGMPPVAVYAAKTTAAPAPLGPAVRTSPLAGVIARALSADPNLRHSSADEMASAIASAMRPSPPSLPIPTAAPPRPTMSGLLLGLGAGGVLVLIGVLVVAVALRYRSAQGPAHSGAPFSPAVDDEPALESVGNGPVARLDEARLRERIRAAGSGVGDVSSQDHGTGCRWIDLQVRQETVWHVFLFVCTSRALAAKENERLRKRGGFTVLEENRVLYCQLADDRSSRELCDALVQPR